MRHDRFKTRETREINCAALKKRKKEKEEEEEEKSRGRGLPRSLTLPFSSG